MTFWEPRDEDALEQLWGDGQPVKRIALALHRSENAIMHKVTHLGLAKRVTPAPRPPTSGNLWFEDDPHAIADFGLNPTQITGDITAAFMGDPKHGARPPERPIGKLPRPPKWS